MEIRKIKKEERLQCSKIAAVAFHSKYDCKVDESEEWPNKYFDQYAAFDDGGKMMATMHVYQHKIYFDGHIVESAGIAGVATLPEYRHKRAVRRILELVFEDMRAKKQYISQLYPFNYAYYNKFGYEAACEKINLRFPFKILNERDDIQRNNRCKLIECGKNADLRKAYEKYASKHNGAYLRDDNMWKDKLTENIYSKMHYPYVYYNENNEPAGYFLYTRDNGFKIIELCFDTPEDIKGILGFIKNFSSDFDSIDIKGIPADEDFSLMFTNQHDIKRSVFFESMTCIADVKKTLELMRYPQGRGSFSISVVDNFQSFNTGIYHINYNNGLIVDIDQKPLNSSASDIEVSHIALAKLVFGTDNLNSGRYKFMDGIKINSNLDTLNKVFIKKKIYLGDFF